MNRPTKIGNYEVIDVIGRGGMGVVYKATDPQLNRLVAIKMMIGGYAEDPDLLKRFYREAQSTASLQHPNIVTVYNLGDQDGNPYMVMQYLEGESLDAIVSARRSLPVLEKIQIILDACRGLSYAHERGIVHRDIKPGNIVVSKDGGAKLVDFGIAHIASKTLTRTGQIMGSLSYMSPEQINGEALDARTDIWSTGVVLYQLLTYVLPFEAETTGAAVLKIIHDPPPPLDRFLTVYPKELESILHRALAKNRDDRYPSADEFALDLVQVHEHLKQELVDRHLREAEIFLAKDALSRARVHLLQLLKLDQKHTQAIKLLRLVQQRIAKEQGSEQARQLRVKAEEAHSQGEFEAALHYLNQAVALDTSNPELPKFREMVRDAKLKAEELQRALRLAEEAHERGDLDEAMKAADEALGISPDSTRAKALYRMIHRDWVERSRHSQLESLLASARKEIDQRNLTAALDILKQAESLDPQDAQVHALVEQVLVGRERERLRKELERINHEAEDALNLDDYEKASIALEEGLRQFPQERGLIQLKWLADRQRAGAERKLFLRQQIASTRQLLDAGQAGEALASLQRAIHQAPHEPQLEALLTVVKERVEREEHDHRRRELDEIRRNTDEALKREDYETASAHVREGLRRFPQELSLVQLKELVEEQYVAAERETFVDRQIASARRLLEASQAGEALALLQAALRKVPQEPQLQALLNMVREWADRNQADDDKSRSVQEAREGLGKHAFREAIRILEGAQLRFVHTAEIDDLLSFAREQERKETERKTLEDATRLAQQWISECQYERAIQLMESTLAQAPDDQLSTILQEARRRFDDHQRDLRATIAKAQKFLSDGTATKAMEFLAAQPESYSASPEFNTLVETARKLQAVEAVDCQVAGELDVDLQVKILEQAERKYPNYTNWDERLQPIRERRDLVLAIVQRARSFEREKNYQDALQEFWQLRRVYGQYPNLAREIERLRQLQDKDKDKDKEDARTRVTSAGQIAANATRLFEPGIEDERAERGQRLAVPRKQARPQPTRVFALPTPDREDIDARDLRVPGTANRTYRSIVGAVAAIILIGVLGRIVWIGPAIHRPHRGSSQEAVISTSPSADSASSQNVVESPTPESVPTNKGIRVAPPRESAHRESSPETHAAGAPNLAVKREKIPLQADRKVDSSTTSTASPSELGGNRSTQPPNAQSTSAGAPINSPTVEVAQQAQKNPSNQSDTIASNQPPMSLPPTTGSTSAAPPQPATSSASRVPETPGLASGSPEKDAIRAALHLYQEAYESESIDELVKIWPSLSRERRKALKQGFDKAHAVRVELECGEPLVAGGSAEVKCDQSMRYTEQGKLLPFKKVSVNILLKKAGGGWLVDNVQAN